MIRRLLTLLSILIGVAIILGHLGFIHPALDSFAHFRLHLMALLTLMGVIHCLSMQWTMSVLSLSVAVITSFNTADYLPSVTGQESHADTNTATVRLLQFNLRFDNPEYRRIAETIKGANADFVVLQEVTFTTGKSLALLKDDYPYQLSCRFSSIGSVALLSRHPFVDNSKRHCVRQLGFARAQFTIDGREISVASLHLHWPWPFRQHTQLDALMPDFEAMQAPLLLAGDFNAAPWSHSVKRVSAATETDIAHGFAPSWLPPIAGHKLTQWLGLQIDNTLHSEEFVLRKRATGAPTFSDHLPVLSVFEFK